MLDDDDAIEQFRERVRIVSEAFRRRPHNVIDELEKLGFVYETDDREDEEEIAEECAALPRTANEKTLVEYFESNSRPNNDLLTTWKQATNVDQPNYPLFRRYLRAGNVQLKALLLFGLERNPADRELLSDMSFFHVFTPMLKELIALYTHACNHENNLECFASLAQDFDDNTHASGYEALIALRDRYPADSCKAECIEQLLTQDTACNEVVMF